MVFLRFQISEKWANLRFTLNIWKQKVFQLQGGFPTTRGSAPGPRWRLRPQTTKCIQNTHANAGRLLDRVNRL